MVRSADYDVDDDDDKVKTSDDTTTMSRNSGVTSSKRRVECNLRPRVVLVLKQEGKRRERKKKEPGPRGACRQTTDGRDDERLGS